VGVHFSILAIFGNSDDCDKHFSGSESDKAFGVGFSNCNINNGVCGNFETEFLVLILIIDFELSGSLDLLGNFLHNIEFRIFEGGVSFL
jgi:hypothetical protein